MIVVSLFARDSAALRRLAASQSALADVLEYRLDGLEEPGAVTEDDLRALFAAGGKPAIVAVNAPDAWGRFAGADRDRLELLLRAARAGATFVDVDWRLATHPLTLPAQCRRIVSRHDTRGTPTDLAREFAELESVLRPTDLPKYVTHARSAEDGVRVLEFARELGREAIVFASGESGRFTRVLAPIFGSAATYAAPVQLAGPAAQLSTADEAPRLVDGGPTAPGQIGVDELRALLPRRGPTRQTQIYGILGRPVRQSLSPRLHGAVFRESARDAVYVPIEPESLERFLPLCRATNWRGFSVTAPFKHDASRLSAEVDDLAREVRAVNTLIRRVDGGWNGSNTDTLAVEDLVRAALERARIGARDARALVIGTGGAARAALCALERLGLESIVVAGRNFHTTVQLALDRAVEAAELGEVAERVFDVVVQCTPAGSHEQPDVMPIDACVLRPGKVFLEAVYRPSRTPLVFAAERVGAHVILGQEWFLAQARAQARKFAIGPWSEATLVRELEAALNEEAAARATARGKGPGSAAGHAGASRRTSTSPESDSTAGDDEFDSPNDADGAHDDGAHDDGAHDDRAHDDGDVGDAARDDNGSDGSDGNQTGHADGGARDSKRDSTSKRTRSTSPGSVPSSSGAHAPDRNATKPPTPTPSPRRGRQLSDIGQRLTQAFVRPPPRHRHVLERTIAFVGLRASGKSTLAAAVARELGATFVDLDEQVVRMVADPELPRVGDVLARHGEAEFRRLESMALIALLTCGEPIVLATGGGVVENPANRELLATHSTPVWLRVPVAELERRLRADPTPRPPLLGVDTVGEVSVLARRREPLYSALAQLTLDAAASTPAELAQQVIERLAASHPDTLR